MSDLRDEYERRVRSLAALAESLLGGGLAVEMVARRVHAERCDLARMFRELTPEPARSVLLARTRALYGEGDGPSIEAMRAAGRSWDEIIAGAARPGKVPSLG